MAMTTREPRLDARYMELLRTFPLRPIRTEEELDAAIAVLDRMLDRAELAPPEADYLVVLSGIVRAYESRHVEIPPVSGVDALRHLMEENGLTQSDLAPLFGGRSVVSEVLSGKRDLSKRHIRELSARFGLPADVFLDSGT